MPPATRKVPGVKSQQSKLTDAFKTSGTRITKPSSSLAKDVKEQKSDSVTLVKGSPPPSTIVNNDAVELSREDDTFSTTLGGDNDKSSSVNSGAEDETIKDYTESVIKRPVVLPQEVPQRQVILAREMTKKQIKSYFDSITTSRLAPTVHQEDLSMNEKVLRHFDLSSQYGPCIGITRFKRWNRAYRLGLEPPIEALAILLQAGLDEGSQANDMKASTEDVGMMAHVNDLLVAGVES